MERRRTILRQVEKWAKSRINDAVRLAFIDEV